MVTESLAIYKKRQFTFFLLVEAVRFALTQLLSTCFTDKPNSLPLACFRLCKLKFDYLKLTRLPPFNFKCLRSRIRTCNLLLPKQVNNQSLSSQFYLTFFLLHLFLAAYMGIEPISPERQSGRLASNPNKPNSFLQNFLRFWEDSNFQPLG